MILDKLSMLRSLGCLPQTPGSQRSISNLCWRLLATLVVWLSSFHFYSLCSIQLTILTKTSKGKFGLKGSRKRIQILLMKSHRTAWPTFSEETSERKCQSTIEMVWIPKTNWINSMMSSSTSLATLDSWSFTNNTRDLPRSTQSWRDRERTILNWSRIWEFKWWTLREISRYNKEIE